MMNRLTKKNDIKYFNEHIRCLEYDDYERFIKVRPYRIDYHSTEVETKLGRLEDLEEKLGCSLEVTFKAIDEGVCVNVKFLDLEKFDIIERPRLYFSDDNNCYCFELLFGEYVVKLKDYGKTWWLKGEKENE